MVDQWWWARSETVGRVQLKLNHLFSPCFIIIIIFKLCLFLYLCILCNTDYFESVMGSGGSILYVLSPPTRPTYR